MELLLRCALRDRPGSLAELAAAIADAGGDIQGLDVVDGEDGRVYDDVFVALRDGDARRLVDRIEGLADVELVHIGPSRGDPGDAVTRVAVGLEAMMSGTASADDGIRALVGGQLRASSAELVPVGEAPSAHGRRLVLSVGDRALVLERGYGFTPTERARAEALANLCTLAAAGAPVPRPPRGA